MWQKSIGKRSCRLICGGGLQEESSSIQSQLSKERASTLARSVKLNNQNLMNTDNQNIHILFRIVNFFNMK
jgi:hypothetical protein